MIDLTHDRDRRAGTVEPSLVIRGKLGNHFSCGKLALFLNGRRGSEQAFELARSRDLERKAAFS